MRPLVENCDILDINYLRKNGFLKEGDWNNICLSWSNDNQNNERTIRVITDVLGENVTLKYEITEYDGEKKFSYNSRLLKKDCNLGGVMYCFECPNCKKRCYKLYRPFSEIYFLCRDCHRINYGKNKNVAINNKIKRIEDKLKRKIWKKTRKKLLQEKKILKENLERNRLIVLTGLLQNLRELQERVEKRTTS